MRWYNFQNKLTIFISIFTPGCNIQNQENISSLLLFIATFSNKKPKASLHLKYYLVPRYCLWLNQIILPMYRSSHTCTQAVHSKTQLDCIQDIQLPLHIFAEWWAELKYVLQLTVTGTKFRVLAFCVLHNFALIHLQGFSLKHILQVFTSKIHWRGLRNCTTCIPKDATMFC